MNAASDLGLVLHAMAWRETSLIIEVFTRTHGRIGLIAKGARRPRSALRGLLHPFQPLDLRWSGKSELRNLIGAEWVGGLAVLGGSAIMPGFYLNELMMRLIPRDDAHPALFDDYLATLGLLAKNAESSSREMTEPILRRFECNLLREMGYAPSFANETQPSGADIDPAGLYQVDPQTGIHRLGVQEPGEDAFHGATLLALASAGGSIEEAVHALENPRIATESKRLLRRLIGHHLGEEGLQSREIMRELVRI
ncbi:MAG: DNA repair protein RecO [Burkholderiaceae bacterium]|nr:DNA repair protein RecO [Burkholderiaceae bacterium]